MIATSLLASQQNFHLCRIFQCLASVAAEFASRRASNLYGSIDWPVSLEERFLAGARCQFQPNVPASSRRLPSDAIVNRFRERNARQTSSSVDSFWYLYKRRLCQRGRDSMWCRSDEWWNSMWVGNGGSNGPKGFFQ